MTYVRSNPFGIMIARAIKAGDSLNGAILSGSTAYGGQGGGAERDSPDQS